MKILSLYTNFPSSVAIIDDDKLIAAVNEERFTRVKNDESFPVHSIDYCLKEAGVSAKELDGVALASFISPFDDIVIKRSTWKVSDYLKEQELRWKPYLIEKNVNEPKSLLEIFPEKIDLNQYPNEYLKKNYKDPKRNEKHWTNRIDLVAEYLGISKDKVKRIDHHKAHAYYSYYCSNLIGKKVLALTADGMGDGVNATINTFDEDRVFERHFSTNKCAIARIYRYMTLLLGMKPNEHEYKLMGLAPYGKEKYSQDSYNVFAETLKISGTEFVWNIEPTDSYYWFKEKLEGHRFDSIAWGLQTWVEKLLEEWTINCMKKFDIYNVIYSGGVAMNIKAMGKLAEIKQLRNLFIGGSASDESLCISSAICLREDMLKDKRNFKRITNLYLGPSSSFNEEEQEINKLDDKKYKILSNINEKDKKEYIVENLTNGKIIGRCAGRMEFGQRALGNRSILADPRNILIKEKINAAIKNRDFWMPFAPIILDKFSGDYIHNPKKLESPFMTIGFKLTEKGYENMIAASHIADKTARPQILRKEDNPELYEIIYKFYEKTGCGSLLNTSFNLHGYPIVSTPKDAIHVFENSDLDILILNNFIIKKIKS